VARVKFCGMTNIEDCEKAIELGADYLGFVFYTKSKRCVSPERARSITERIGSRIRKVGVFVDETDDQIRATMDFCGLDFCQLYRRSTIEKSITAFRIKDRLVEAVPPQGLILLDSYSAGFGGSGKPFDFGVLDGEPFLDRSFIAGGIGGENVLEVLRLRPYGVDLVSSVEEHPGKKDHDKMAAFMKKVRLHESASIVSYS